ncbi:MAG: hypothetical protein QG635_2225 [Bacteroidota bacterium]|nr:hypothetical protein [Bacteroidota bacterium]
MNRIKYSILVVLLAVFATQIAPGQGMKIRKWVVGSGGSVSVTNKENAKLSCTVSQLAIDKISSGESFSRTIAYQGFWMPGFSHATGIDDHNIASNYQISNYPNPFNKFTTIKYTLPGTAYVTLKIYSLNGQLRKALVNELQSSGEQKASWDGTDNSGQNLSSGSYIYELEVRPAQMTGAPSFNSYLIRNTMIMVK